MLILAGEGTAQSVRAVQARRAAGWAALLLLVALAVWLAVWWRSHAANMSRDAASPASTHSDMAELPGDAALGSVEIAPDAVLGFLASTAKDMGLTWMAVQMSETPRVSPGEALRLENWQAQISLQGRYPAVKRWLREAVGRYPHLALQSARWARAGSGAPSPVGSADALDVQLQLVWLRGPVGRNAAASAPSAASGVGAHP